MSTHSGDLEGTQTKLAWRQLYAARKGTVQSSLGFTLLALAGVADLRGTDTRAALGEWVTTQSICKLTGMDITSARNNMIRLYEKRMIDRRPRDGRTNEYRVRRDDDG